MILLPYTGTKENTRLYKGKKRTTTCKKQVLTMVPLMCKVYREYQLAS